MSKQTNTPVRKDRFVITEREDTGRLEFTRVSAVTGNRSRMYIAENRTDARNWMRTHPELDSALYTYVTPAPITEALSNTVYGLNHKVMFSPQVTNDKYSPDDKTQLTKEHIAHIHGKIASALARASAQHPDISTMGKLHWPQHGNTTEWGQEPGAEWEMFGGPLDRTAQEILTKEFADEFKQDAVMIHDPVAHTNEEFKHTNKIKTMNGELPTNQKPIMKEAKEEKPASDSKEDDSRKPKGRFVKLPDYGGSRVVPSGQGPDADETREEESTMENDDKITESMFLTGENNTLVGQSQVDYRNMLAGEIFGAAAFSTQRPHADTHEGANVVMDTQAAEGMGVLRPVGPPSANMNEDTSFNKHMLNMAKSLFRANRMDEAAKIVDALDSPSTAASKVLEAALATDGVVDEKLTEDLYNAAAYYSSLNNE